MTDSTVSRKALHNVESKLNRRIDHYSVRYDLLKAKVARLEEQMTRFLIYKTEED